MDLKEDAIFEITGLFTPEEIEYLLDLAADLKHRLLTVKKRIFPVDTLGYHKG